MKTKWALILVAWLFHLIPHDAHAGGACTCARFHDWWDLGCSQCFAGAGGPGSGQSGAGGNQAQCTTCTGMPRWWVSEPFINLCLSDTPLSYTLSSGQEMAFRFYYRQRSVLPGADEVSALPAYPLYNPDNYPNVINCGTNASWGNNWTLSVSVWDPQWESDWMNPGNGKTYYPPSGYPVYSRGYQAYVWRPEGGINYYNIAAGAQNTLDPQSLVNITSVVSGQNYPAVCTEIASGVFINTPRADANGIYWGDTGVGLKLVYPDGSQDVFGLTGYPMIDYARGYPYTPTGVSTTRLLLTQRIDPQGRITRVGYEQITSPYYVYRVRYVVDPDGRTNTFLYNSGFQLSQINDPYGCNLQIGYITPFTGVTVPGSLTDAAGMTSSFGYQGVNGWLTSLTTPYGTTRFNYYQVQDPTTTNGYSQRALYVSEPEGAAQFYLYQHQNPGLVPASEPSPANVPGQSFDDGTSGSTPHHALTYRDTFHWGRRQFAALAANGNFIGAMNASLADQFSNPAYSQSEFAAALTDLTPNNYNQAELKHWLLLGGDEFSITESVSSERDPSADAAGNIAGLWNWYNYAGKPSPELLGSSPQITCLARLLPDGSSQYTTWHYYPLPPVPNGNGLVSDSEASISLPNNTPGVLTNWFFYAANGIDLTGLSNSAGQFVNAGYNGNHQIVALTNALNQTATVSWDPNTFNLTGRQWFNGQSETINYYPLSGTATNTSALPQQISLSPQGRTFTFNNYQAGRPASMTDDRGVTLASSYDGLNRLTGTVFPDGTSISNLYSRLDVVATKDRLNNWTWYAYDGLDHLITVTNANNALTMYSWCGCGSLTAILDALTNLTTLNYDNQGNLTNVTYPDASSLTWQFDLAGRMTNAFDGAGRSLQIGYNNQGLATSITGTGGAWQQTIYDALNRPVSVTDDNGITVSNQFDPINELVQRTWPDGIGENYGYSAAGLIAYTNRDRQVTLYGRDLAGRLTSVTNANFETDQFAYDSLDHVISLIDGLHHKTTWQYNEFGWLTNKLDGLNRNAFRYAYDADGRLTNRWTPEKGNTGYAWDNVGNLKTIAYPALTLRYAYDALNELTNLVDAVGTTAFSYTPAGRLQGETGPWANDLVTNSYVQGLRTALSILQPGGVWSQTYAYDALWRMTNLVSPAGAFNYTYAFQPASRLVTGVSLPNGANLANSYDALARLHQTALNNYWGHTLDGYTYGMDAVGLRTNILRNLGLTSSDVSVGYDNIGQLVSWTAQETNATPRLNEQLGFGFDAADNLHLRTNNALLQNFTVDAANQLASVTRAGTFTESGATPAPAASVTVNGQSAQTYGDFTFAAANLPLSNGNNSFTTIAQNAYGVRSTNTVTANLPASVTLSYDNNGNLTNDGTRSFAYDCENQLTNITLANQWKTDFVYDGLNRRRIARDFTWTNSAWVLTNEVHYIYDGLLAIQERDANNNTLVTYTRGLDLSGSIHGAGGIGGLLARTDTSGSTYYHADGAGNITALMDGSENIVGRYLYGPFGKPIGQWGPMAAVNAIHAFSMYQHDGITLYPFRGYASDFGRFLNQDPIGENGGINLYGFGANSPINYVDPYGLSWYSDIGSWANGVYNNVGDAEYNFYHYLFIGGPGPGPDPNSDLAMAQQAGYGFHQLYDQNGNPLGNPAAAVGENVVNSLATAAMMMTPMGEEEAGAAALGKAKQCENVVKSLPDVVKAVNSNLPHAVEQAVERNVFKTADEAAKALRDLSQSITQNGFPAGTLPDTVYADRVLVPVGNNGMAVYQVGANGTAKLKTVLIAH